LYIVSPSEIDEIEVRKSVQDQGSGAVVTFTGVIREYSAGKNVKHLYYEAHVSMAERHLKKIADTAMTKWELNKIAVQHRIGNLKVGEIAVVIAVSAPHRKDAFQACQFIIDSIKTEVPIWKKEVYEDGSQWIGLDHDNTNRNDEEYTES
jgi:molybdopterin synthase catalytic subunit